MFILILISMSVVLLTSMTAATVYISESNLAGEFVTDNITNISFGSVDQPNIVAATHPIIQAESSYFKMLRFKVQSLGTSTTIKDLRWWKSSGAYVASEIIRIIDRQSGGFNNTVVYTQPSQSTSPNPPFTGATIDLRTSDPGTACVGIGGSLAGTIIAAPNYSEYFAAQLQTGAGTPVGPVNQKVITLQYEET